ncbi:HDOD domain protein [Marinomonas spartinae]|uniref:HDOD domain protein n=1 Tax=Marinomonas spartinae TaxID=1792290 RepID=A0A1A8TDQ8_9GAMM|nr:HDOD domain-containing protein [Marinomonas spartinae]SBS30165.1 HDOD domain protein [Marinomonas spartinae]
MDKKPPFGLNEWLDFLKKQKFPVRKGNLARLKNQTKTPDEALDRLQTNIASEPFIAFALLNEANKVVPNKRSDIKTPHHAAAMIGMNGITAVLKNLIPYEHLAKDPAHAAMVREVQSSYEAATIAKHWAIEKRASHEEDIFWTTFFRDTPRWLMWFYCYPTMRTLQKRILEGEKANQAESDVLGCRMDEITVHISKYWGTPINIIHSFITKFIPTTKELQELAQLTHNPEELPKYTEDKRLTLLANNPLIFSYCASKVAHEAATYGWQAKTLPFYYRVISTVIHCHLGRTIQLTHYASVEAANLHPNRGKIPLACQLLSPTLYTKDETFGTQLKTGKKKPSALNALKVLCQNNDIQAKHKAIAALKALNEVIKKDQRTIILKYSKGKISPLFQQGYETDKIKAVTWNSPSSVFSKLSQKRSAIQLNGDKLARFVSEFPINANKLLSKNEHLMLASTTVTEGEVHILWLASISPFTENDYNHLKQVVQLISHLAK